MADNLTPQQAQAVHDRGGRLLVSAAAGSGKTKVLVDRLLTYLTDAEDPANLDDFLIITYTKAAASELRGKIASKLTEKIALQPENRHLQKQMQRLFLTKISTVHGFCGDLLREYAYKLDIPADFRVADENECRELRTQVLTDLLDRAYEESAQDPDFRGFVDSQGLGRDDRLVPEIIQKVYDSARCHMDPDAWLDSCLTAAELGEVQDVSETLWGRFLMEDLKSALNSHISVLEQCFHAAEDSGGMEKVVLNLKDTVNRLETLRSSHRWDDIVHNRNIDYGRLTFPRKNVDADLAERIKAARNACKKHLEKKLRAFADDSAQILADMQQCTAGTRGLIRLVKGFDAAYSAAKKSRRCLDFSDLEHKTLDLLLGKSRGGPTAAASEIGRRFREILVDEYQDSNGVQDAIFMTLSRERQNCFLVGDVKQSIYQFRLADPGIFLEKYHHYLPADQATPGQGRKVLLSHNFRSGREVISCVNDVFRACMSPEVGGLYYTDEEALREGIPQPPMPDAAVELYAIDVRESSYEEEAAFTAERIAAMLRDGTQIRRNGVWKAVEPEDIVILLRSPGSAAGYFQRALEARGIRCASGGGSDLLQTEEVSTLLSLLQTVLNPRQDIPLLSVLASPLFGFTANDLAAFRGACKRGSIYDALLKSEGARAKNFLEILSILRREARMSTLTGLLERCYSLTHIDSIYATMPGGVARVANLQTFYQLAADFEKGTLRNLAQFLEHLEALKDRGLLAVSPAAADAVNIMSIHKSKGLEFPVVFLCNLSRKFNQEDMRAQILCDRDLGLGLSVADPARRIRYDSVSKRAIAVKMAAQSVSEELRVLYVAMTRARDRLIMTYASQTLEADLKEIALRGDFDGGSLLCREAICLGDWVLLAAMGRLEAGELHALGGRPAQTMLAEHPWLIRVTQAPEQITPGEVILSEPAQPPAAQVQQIRQGLIFQYPWEQATQAPSKQTATDRKGRFKDAEAAEDTRETKPAPRTWRKPAFLAPVSDGRAVGNTIHQVMQYIRYDCCGSTEGVETELRRLVENGFLTEQQRSLVDPERIAGFFRTEPGRKLCAGTPCLREFKFSILDEGSRYGTGLDGEQVLLQGVVDCALLEEDGITVLDFKTDHVTEATVSLRAEDYRPQLEAYCEALSRIYEKPVKQAWLYFFRLGRLYPL